MTTKEKIIELINKIYEEKNEDKVYNLIFELYLLTNNNFEKVKEIILEPNAELEIKVEKIRRFIFNPKWDDYKKKRGVKKE